ACIVFRFITLVIEKLVDIGKARRGRDTRVYCAQTERIDTPILPMCLRRDHTDSDQDPKPSFVAHVAQHFVGEFVQNLQGLPAFISSGQDSTRSSSSCPCPEER